MKVNFFVFLCLLLGIGGFSACSDDEVNQQNPKVPEISGVTEQDISDVQVIDSGRVSWHDHYTGMLKDAQQGNSEKDSLVEVFAKRQLELNDSLADAYMDSLGHNGHLPDVDEGWSHNYALGYQYVSLRYKPIDKDGKTIECSELVVAPYNLIFKDPRPDNLVIGCHSTITSNHERPSNFESFSSDVGMLACHALTNFQTIVHENLVIIPDYQGYGATHGDAHPYLSQDLTARQVVDGVIAGKKWYEKYGRPLEKDFKTLALGYSQGGSVAMAVHRYIEKNGLVNSLNFSGSICGDGPYDPVATLKKYIADNKIYMPVAAGLIIKGMCDANPYMSEYSPSDYFTEAFLKSDILKMIESKDLTITEIEGKLLDYSMTNSNGFVMMRKSKTDNAFLPYVSSNTYTVDGKKRKWEKATKEASYFCTVDQVLRPEVIEYFKNGGLVEVQYMGKMSAIQNALEMNNLTRGWMPQHPMFVFHAEKDEVVPFVNYESASAAFPGKYFKGKKYTKSDGTHVTTGTTFYLWRENSYFASIIYDCWDGNNQHDEKDDYIF